MEQSRIRNFTIIGHIDHGKSTLADRLLELTGTMETRQMREQVLDRLAVERERGITVKLKSVRMQYTYQGTTYILNLIDTPGHVDFSYEVSRSLAACEGAILVVDATQGVQAQTIANASLAKQHHLTIIPVINKIDGANADPVATMHSLCEQLGFEEDEIVYISAKEGTNVQQVLARLITRVPAPAGDSSSPFTALAFDSFYDTHKGVVISIRVTDGQVATGDEILLMGSRQRAAALQLGVFAPQMLPQEKLSAGEVGYIATGLKDVRGAQVGDTVTHVHRQALNPLLGYRPAKPMVFVGMYPADQNDYIALREAIGKLQLNDAALSCIPDTSRALGNGFRCGFLGLLHAEVTQERLEEEFGLHLIISAPSVVYRVDNTEVSSPIALDLTGKKVEEPWVAATILTPAQYVGDIMQLTSQYRAVSKGMEYVGNIVRILYEMPLQEFMSGYYDRLKSVSSGYASLDYTFLDYRPVDVVRLDILVNREEVDALSQLVVRERAREVGSKFVESLKEAIPRQQFEIPIQAAIGGKIIARADIPAFRKDVTAKLYGGDRTRKDKLLEAQKKGKARLKRIGRVQIPQEAFFAVFDK